MRQVFTFRIAGGYTPRSMPLERLGEYLEALGRLFGESAHVHFGQLEEGSTLVRTEVEDVAVPKVEKRVRKIAAGEGPSDGERAYERLDELLRDDNATGVLTGGEGNVIHVDFPGKNKPKPIAYGPVKQIGGIDGEVFRVEGRDSTVHVGVMDGQRTYALEAPAAMGQDLAALFRTGPVRFRGEGTWFRHGPGEWELRRFKIDAIEALDNAPLSAAIGRLREIGAGDWKSSPSPFSDLAAERELGESEH